MDNHIWRWDATGVATIRNIPRGVPTP